MDRTCRAAHGTLRRTAAVPAALCNAAAHQDIAPLTCGSSLGPSRQVLLPLEQTSSSKPMHNKPCPHLWPLSGPPGEVLLEPPPLGCAPHAAVPAQRSAAWQRTCFAGVLRHFPLHLCTTCGASRQAWTMPTTPAPACPQAHLLHARPAEKVWRMTSSNASAGSPGPPHTRLPLLLDVAPLPLRSLTMPCSSAAAAAAAAAASCCRCCRWASVTALTRSAARGKPWGRGARARKRACQSPAYASAHVGAAPGQRASASGCHRPASAATARRYLSCEINRVIAESGEEGWKCEQAEHSSDAARDGAPAQGAGKGGWALDLAVLPVANRGCGAAAWQQRAATLHDCNPISPPTCRERAARSWAESRLQEGARPEGRRLESGGHAAAAARSRRGPPARYRGANWPATALRRT